MVLLTWFFYCWKNIHPKTFMKWPKKKKIGKKNSLLVFCGWKSMSRSQFWKPIHTRGLTKIFYYSDDWKQKIYTLEAQKSQNFFQFFSFNHFLSFLLQSPTKLMGLQYIFMNYHMTNRNISECVLFWNLRNLKKTFFLNGFFFAYMLLKNFSFLIKKNLHVETLLLDKSCS